MADLDVLTLTATEAQQLLRNQKLTSVALVEAYLTQIGKHNHNGFRLNALISVAPREDLLKTASRLDEERAAGHARGPLHGIPFIIKDVFVTLPSLGMPTTCGTPCFAKATTKRTAPLIQYLLDQGMILLGKANLTEFCGLKFKGLTPGYSSFGGQTQNPYIFGGLEKDEKLIGHSSPGGSSAGSAAGVAAGFAPLSIGTECCGSIITPANRAGLYALKCGLHTVDDEGCFKYNDCIDCIGGLAKSAQDLASFIAALQQRKEPYDLNRGLAGLRVGFTDVNVWRLPETMVSWPGDTRQQMEDGYSAAIATLKANGVDVETDIDLPRAEEYMKRPDGKSHFWEIAMHQLKQTHMQAFFDEFSESEVHSLEEMIEWNKKHADTCLPQDELEGLLASNREPAEMEAMIIELRDKSKSALDRHFEAGMDIVVALADSSLVRYSSGAGKPVFFLIRTA
ncbi:hypothetical protein LTR62_006699 [Meristemomyces frigidus]|uniref:Amidase domain-containing protein n=1 Tax=Meristemomyces frigidus TaxID=1508187 RepID=A0AAN7TNR5_9PEZI|nr:hypothetical protein LTR62_006699 [Meristemomyces frigidus]